MYAVFTYSVTSFKKCRGVCENEKPSLCSQELLSCVQDAFLSVLINFYRAVLIRELCYLLGPQKQQH